MQLKKKEYLHLAFFQTKEKEEEKKNKPNSALPFFTFFLRRTVFFSLFSLSYRGDFWTVERNDPYVKGTYTSTAQWAVSS